MAFFCTVRRGGSGHGGESGHRLKNVSQAEKMIFSFRDKTFSTSLSPKLAHVPVHLQCPDPPRLTVHVLRRKNLVAMDIKVLEVCVPDGVPATDATETATAEPTMAPVEVNAAVVEDEGVTFTVEC